MDYQIVPFSEKYKTSLIKLLGYMWKSLSEDQIKEKFEWRYELNPFQEEPFIFLATDESDNVVGFRAFVVQNFCLQNNRVKIYNPADAIIHPHHRRKGLFSKMTKTLIETVTANDDRGIILNLSSNEKSTPGYLNLGWIRTNGIKKYGYRVSVKNFLGVRKKERIEEYKEKTNYGTFELTNTIKAGLLGFNKFNIPYHGDTLHNCRSEAFYLWRYHSAPDKDRYISAYLMDLNKITAYVIVKKLSKQHYSLMEFGAESEFLLEFLLHEVMKKVHIPILRSWMINQKDQEVLSKCGFITESPWMLKLLKKKRLAVLVRPTTPYPKNDDFIFEGLDIRNVENWHFQLADRH